MRRRGRWDTLFITADRNFWKMVETKGDFLLFLLMPIGLKLGVKDIVQCCTGKSDVFYYLTNH